MSPSRSVSMLFTLLIAPPCALHAQEICSILDGDKDLDHFGQAVGRAGDIDGDGFSDMIVGIPKAKAIGGNIAGRVHVYSPNGDQLLLELQGTKAFAEFGFAVAGAGDVNNDGFPDMIVGSPYAEVNNKGLTQVYSGSDGALLYNLTVPSGGFNALHGYSVAGVGDLQGDGFDDFMVGSPSFSGRTFVYSGANGATLHTLVGVDAALMGTAVAGGGDVDLDGVPDLLVCSRLEPVSAGKTGRARVYSGADFSILRTVTSPLNPATFADSCAFLGDINFDGRDDFAVGAIASTAGNGTANGAFVFSGSDGTLIRSHLGSVGNYNDDVGFSIASLSDVDHDGVDDYILGAPNFLATDGYIRGKIQTLSGKSGAVVSEMFGEGHFDNFGYAIASLGDVNGDQVPDVLVGSPLDDDAGNNAGRAFLITPTFSALPPTPIVAGDLITGTIFQKGIGFGFNAVGGSKVTINAKSTTFGFAAEMILENDGGTRYGQWTLSPFGYETEIPFSVPADGLYVIRLHGPSNALSPVAGSFLIDTDVEVPPSNKDIKAKLKGNPVQTIPFTAIVGTTVDIKVKPLKKTGPFSVELRDPHGLVVDISPFGSFTSTGKFKATDIPIEQNGAYSLHVSSFTKKSHGVKVIVDLSPPKNSKINVEL